MLLALMQVLHWQRAGPAVLTAGLQLAGLYLPGAVLPFAGHEVRCPALLCQLNRQKFSSYNLPCTAGPSIQLQGGLLQLEAPYGISCSSCDAGCLGGLAAGSP